MALHMYHKGYVLLLVIYQLHFEGEQKAEKKAEKNPGLILICPYLTNLFGMLVVKEKSSNTQSCTELSHWQAIHEL